MIRHKSAPGHRTMTHSLLGLVVSTVHLLLATTTVSATTYGNYGSSNYGSSSTSSGYTTSSSTSSAVYGTNFFAESSNTLYDGYQQAWRYLGWYVDCGNPSGRYNDRHNSHASHENSQTYGNMYCQRYLMWAAVRGLRSGLLSWRVLGLVVCACVT